MLDCLDKPALDSVLLQLGMALVGVATGSLVKIVLDLIRMAIRNGAGEPAGHSVLVRTVGSKFPYTREYERQASRADCCDDYRSSYCCFWASIFDL